MQLEQLCAHLPILERRGDWPNQSVEALVYDSRSAGPGSLFVALTGSQADGHAFVPAAARAGARAAVVSRWVEDLPGLCQVRVADTRAALAALADLFHGRPSDHMTLVGVTGTNGKTTVSYLVEAVLAGRGPVGVVGTVETRFAGQRQPSAMTSPQSADLQALLDRMRQAGVEQAVCEISSHALDQRRAEAVAWDAAVFTNLTRDHLDYHGDMDAYFEAKARLFSELLPAARERGKPGLAVVNQDDPRGAQLASRAREQGLPVISYGFAAGADLRGEVEELNLRGGGCRVHWQGQTFLARTSLIGRHNLSNLLAAAGVGLGLGLSPQEVVQGLAGLHRVPGRLDPVPAPPGSPLVLVDYAHTDDALKNVLGTLGPLTPGRLICVFGAGGDRDPGKRPLMGRAVARGCHLAVLTSDNPRGEDPQAIMAMIEPGLREGGLEPAPDLSQPGRYVRQPDRAQAIALAVESSGPGDVVLIAGKGHEDYQIVGQHKRHFDDREQAIAALNGRAAGGRG